MSATAKKIEVMQAYERGEQIEFCYCGEWEYCSNPFWNWANTNYRVAPKPKKTVELYQWLCNDYHGYYISVHSEKEPRESVKRLDNTKMIIEVDNV